MMQLVFDKNEWRRQEKNDDLYRGGSDSLHDGKFCVVNDPTCTTIWATLPHTKTMEISL